MDINRVELKGRISSDITTRTSKNGEPWLSFSVVTNEWYDGIKKDKSIPTWTNVMVFADFLIEKIKKLGAHKGTPIWLIGKLYGNYREIKGSKFSAMSVVALEVECLQTTKEKPTIIAPHDENNYSPF